MLSKEDDCHLFCNVNFEGFYSLVSWKKRLSEEFHLSKGKVLHRSRCKSADRRFVKFTYSEFDDVHNRSAYFSEMTAMTNVSVLGRVYTVDAVEGMLQMLTVRVRCPPRERKVLISAQSFNPLGPGGE